MEDPDLEPQRATPPKKNLAPLSITELDAYIAELEEEIVRVRADITAKRRQRGGAEALFKPK
jgi:uncharacterized small protein (DUF1192 family)